MIDQLSEQDQEEIMDALNRFILYHADQTKALILFGLLAVGFVSIFIWLL